MSFIDPNTLPPIRPNPGPVSVQDIVFDAGAAIDALSVQIGGAHYKSFKYQPVEIAHHNGLTFLEGNVVKRVHRHSRGGKGLQDIEKAIHELKLIAKLQYDKDIT